MAEMASQGIELPALTLEITQDRLNAYCASSGDNNPLHWDAEFAATTQFGGIVAHGMLTLALISRMMAAAYGQDWLETGNLRTRFKGAAYLGDQVSSRGRVSREEQKDGHRLVTCTVAVINSKSGEELVTGSATVKVKGSSR